MTLAPLDLQGDVVAKLLARSQPTPRRLVEQRHLVIGVGEDDPASVGLGLTLPIPAVDQIDPRPLARLSDMDRIMLLVRAKRFLGALGGKLARRHALPVLALATNVGDLDAAMALGDTAERRPRFDRLELFGVADQHDLGAAPLGFGNDPLELACADHARLVDDEDRLVGEEVAPLPPLMLEAGDGARRDA